MTRPTGAAGLQPQRTALAWNRTALALGANAALILTHQIGTSGEVVLAGAGVLALLIAAVAVLLGARRRTALRRDPRPGRSVPGGQVRALGWAVTALAVLVAVALLLP